MVTFSFPQPAKLLNLNQREHWAPRSAKTRAWRHAGRFAALDAINRRELGRMLPRSIVTVTLPVKSLKVRRDPHNLVPTMKAIIDGLVDAGVWADDSGEHVVTAEPRLKQGGDVDVTIEALA